MYFDTTGNCWIAQSSSDFRGWEFLGKEFYKVGEDGQEVYKVSIRHIPKNYYTSGSKAVAEFMTVFTSKKDLPKVVDGMCV
jgi:hypothetical protein